MQPETHVRADELNEQIAEEKENLEVFQNIEKYCKNNPVSRNLKLASPLSYIEIPGRAMSMIYPIINKFLEDKIEQLEKEYKEL